MLCLLSLPAMAAKIKPFPLDDAVPGGVAVVVLPVTGTAAPKANLAGQRVMVVQHGGQWYALAALALDTTPGDKSLDVEQLGAPGLSVSFSVMPKEYPTQTLTISNPEMVNPTPEQLKRIDREAKHLDKVMSGWRETARPAISFIWPAKGPETSGFGLRRVLNGEPRSPHSGIDIGAPTGTAVDAPADARVADIGNYYYCGKTLTLDMGQGLFSVYCHLSKIKVNVGQKVKQGQLVGRIGATGRTTGPNLHWTVRLEGTVVDPHVFLGYNAPTPPPTTPPKAATAAAPAVATQQAAKPASTAAPAATTHASRS
jgi:murein DD-endopeptidase MepM/ murein hydrolase activator NlpD